MGGGSKISWAQGRKVPKYGPAYGTWRFGLQVVGLVWSCGLCVRFAECCSILQTVFIKQPVLGDQPTLVLLIRYY